MSLAQVSAAILALRAIGSAVNVLLAACLFAVCAVRAVRGICYVACTGACIAVLANRAIFSGCNVSRAFDGLIAVQADRAVFCSALVSFAGNCGVTYRAFGVTNVDVRVSRAGNCLAAVCALSAIGSKRSVSVARTNVITAVAGYIMLIIVGVRRRTLKSALTVTSCITVIGPCVVKSGLAELGLCIFFTAKRADLIENLCVVAICRRLGHPFAVLMSCRSYVVATLAFTILIARISILMLKCRIAGTSFFCVTNGAVSCLNLSDGAVRRRFGSPVILEYVRNGSYVVALGNVTIGVAYVIEGVLNLSYVVTIVVVALSVTNEGVSMLADGIANLRFLYVTNGAVSCLNLSSEAVGSGFGLPCAKDMLSAGNSRAANPTHQAILFPSLVAGAFSVVAAIVTLKVGNAIVGMRRNTLEVTANNVTYSIAVVVVLVLGLSGVAALAVAIGIAIMVKCMAESTLVADSGFFSAADAANLVLNLILKTGFGNLGYPFSEYVNDNSYVIAILAVAIGIASMIEYMVQRTLTYDDIFVSADLAESMELFSGGTSSGNLSSILFGVAMSDGSLIAAFCAVAGRVTSIVEHVVKSSFALADLFLTAKSTISCLYCCFIAGSCRLNSPIAEIVNTGANGLTSVTIGIASIVINVIGNNTRCTANVTIAIASMIVGVSRSDSQFAANVTVCIANGSVNVVGNHSQFAANITSGVTSVGVGVSLGNSGSTANVTGLITSIGVGVIGNSQCAAEVTVGIAIVAVDVLGCFSYVAANVAITVAGAIIGVSQSILTNIVASLAFCGASALVGVRNSFSDLAANITLGVVAISEGVIGLGLAGYAIAFITRRIAGAGVHMVFAEAARKSEEHQRQGKCTKQ